MDTIFRKGPISPNMAQKLLRLTDQANPNKAKLFKKRFRLADGSVAVMVTNRLGLVPSHKVRVQRQEKIEPPTTFFWFSGCDTPAFAIRSEGSEINLYSAGTTADRQRVPGPVGVREPWYDCAGDLRDGDAQTTAHQQWINGVFYLSLRSEFPIGEKIATILTIPDAVIQFEVVKANFYGTSNDNPTQTVLVGIDSKGRMFGVKFLQLVYSQSGEVESTSFFAGVPFSALKQLGYWVDTPNMRAASNKCVDGSDFSWLTDIGWWIDLKGIPVMFGVSNAAWLFSIIRHSGAPWRGGASYEFSGGDQIGASAFYVVDENNQYWRGTFIRTYGVDTEVNKSCLPQHRQNKYLHYVDCSAGSYWSQDFVGAEDVAPTMTRISEEEFIKYAVPYAVWVRYDELACDDPLPMFSDTVHPVDFTINS